MTIEENIEAMGLSLPPMAKPLASYVPAVRTSNFVYCSGQLPIREGTVTCTGKVGPGGKTTEDDAREAAQLCALNCLAAIKGVAGDLDTITRVVRITGYVNSAPNFSGQPTVLNGASDLIKGVFGERGEHTRVAVGVAELPLNAAVEVEMIVEVG